MIEASLMWATVRGSTMTPSPCVILQLYSDGNFTLHDRSLIDVSHRESVHHDPISLRRIIFQLYSDGTLHDRSLVDVSHRESVDHHPISLRRVTEVADGHGDVVHYEGRGGHGRQTITAVLLLHGHPTTQNTINTCRTCNIDMGMWWGGGGGCGGHGRQTITTVLLLHGHPTTQNTINTCRTCNIDTGLWWGGGGVRWTRTSDHHHCPPAPLTSYNGHRNLIKYDL